MKFGQILVIIFIPCFLQSQVLQKFEFLPQKKIIPLFTADATAHRMGVTSINFGRKVSVSLGNVFPVVDVEFYGQPVRLGVGASVHAELHPDNFASLVTTDFFVDYVLVDVPLVSNWILRMGIGHSSHHLSDNWYELLQKTKSVVYSKDYVQLFVVKKNTTHGLFVYGGAIYSYAFIVNNEISRPWMLQCGGEQEVVSYFHDMLALYCAIDIKVRQEASFASTQNYQLGLRVQNNAKHNLRLAYQFRNGIDERGQYYNKRRSFHGVCVFFEF